MRLIDRLTSHPRQRLMSASLGLAAALLFGWSFSRSLSALDLLPLLGALIWAVQGWLSPLSFGRPPADTGSPAGGAPLALVPLGVQMKLRFTALGCIVAPMVLRLLAGA
jgi:hypothetical protein